MVWTMMHSRECSSPEEAVAAVRSRKDSGADRVPSKVPGETAVEGRTGGREGQADNGADHHIGRMPDREVEEAALVVNRIQEQGEVGDMGWRSQEAASVVEVAGPVVAAAAVPGRMDLEEEMNLKPGPRHWSGEAGEAAEIGREVEHIG